MPIFLIKSLLSIILMVLVFFAVFTMFEVFGRPVKKYNIEKLKKLHRINGWIYAALFFTISYICLSYIFGVKPELSPRANTHAVISMTILGLLVLKVLFVRTYKGFYNHAKAVGMTVAVLSLVMVGSSAGYYLLVTKFGTESMSKPAVAEPEAKEKIALKTDAESIGQGKELYDSKCYLCHDPESDKTIVGPGHKGIFKNPILPISKRPSTPENVALQIRKPIDKMPPFDYLSAEELSDIIAYLNTL